MSIMNTMKICSGCQKPIEANAPDGLCPECLLKAGLGTGVDLGPDSQAEGGQVPFVALRADDLINARSGTRRVLAVDALLLLCVMTAVPWRLVAQQSGATPGSPVDPAILQQARKELESYYSQIESIRLVYSTEWTPAAENRERVRRQREQAGLVDRIEECDLLFTPQDQRFEIREIDTRVDGSKQRRTDLIYLRGGERIEVMPYAKQASIITAPQDGLGLRRHPLQAVGLQIPGAEQFSITALLNFPDITRLEKEETIEALRTLVLTIGPGIPDRSRGRWMTKETTVKVWLARDRHHLPLKTEIRYLPNQDPYQLAVHKLVETQDAQGHKGIVFPREVDFADGGGTTRWIMKEVEIKPQVSASDFEVKIPLDFAVQKDGRDVSAKRGAIGPPHDVQVDVLDVRGRPIEGADVSAWNDTENDTVIAAVIKGTADKPQPLRRDRTKKEGTVALTGLPGEDVRVWAEHPDYRPAHWRVGPQANQLRVYLLPKTKGVVQVEGGSPVQRAAVTSEVGLIDGAYVLAPTVSSLSDAQGKFVLETPYQIRTPNEPVPVAAVDREGRAAIAVRLANELDKPLNLTLVPTRRVRVTLEFPGPTGSSPESVGVRWEDDKGRAFLAYSVRRSKDNPNRYAAVQPLPPGSYRLVAEKTPVSEELNVPVELAPGKEDVDLRVLVAQPSQLRLLQRRPAPELGVTWRANEQKTLSALKGKVLVLYFWGYWCVPCVQGMPSLMDAADKFRDEPVVWLAVHDGSLTKMEELEAKLRELEKRWARPLNLTPVLDQRESETSSHGGVTCSRYGIGIFPTLVVIDRDGNVFGYVAKEDLEGTIRKLVRR